MWEHVHLCSNNRPTMFDIEIEITNEHRVSSQSHSVPRPTFIYAALDPKSTVIEYFAAMQQYLLQAGVRMQHVEIFLMGVSSLLA